MFKDNQTKLALVAGIALGYATTLFLSDKVKQKHKRALTKSGRYFNQVLTNPDERQRIQEVFGDYSRQFQTEYRNITSQVANKLGELRETAQTINKQKYADLVANVIEDLEQEGELKANQLTKIRQYIMDDFQAIKQAWSKADQNYA